MIVSYGGGLMTEKRFMIGDNTECPVIEGKFELNIEEITDLLNKQDEHLNILRDELELVYKKYTELEIENEQLKDKNALMKGRIINAIVKSNQVECNCSPCVCEEYINEELKRW